MASSNITIEKRALSRKIPCLSLIESSFSAFPFPFDFYSSAYCSYNWDRSTEENFRSSDQQMFCGKYKHIRERLDYKYHAHYYGTRQLLQDSIIDSLLLTPEEPEGENNGEQSKPYIIFTAGCMGAGKTHTVRKLSSSGQFPLKSFVSVDPDEIRRLLPEYNVYIANNPLTAGELTRKEAGLIAEILTEAALERDRNVLVDGSLRDADWYQNYFEVLRESHPRLNLGIVHVTANIEDIYLRVEVRNPGSDHSSIDE